MGSTINDLGAEKKIILSFNSFSFPGEGPPFFEATCANAWWALRHRFSVCHLTKNQTRN